MNLLSICSDCELERLIRYLGKMRNPGRALNITDNHNWTPLHHLVGSKHYNGKYDRIQCVQLLMQYPTINLQIKSYEGLTPFFLACSEPNIQIEVIHMLIEKDIDAVAMFNNEQMPPIWKAIECGRLDIVIAILNTQKFNIDHQDIDGDSILHIACLHAKVDIIMYLIQYTSVDKTLMNTDGFTALKIAVQQFNTANETHQKCLSDLFHACLPEHFSVSDVLNTLIQSTLIPKWSAMVCTSLIHKYYATDNTKYPLIQRYIALHFKDGIYPNFPLCLLFHNNIIGDVLFQNYIKQDTFFYEFNNLIIHIIENCTMVDGCYQTIIDIITTINLPAMDYIPIFDNWSKKYNPRDVMLLEKICDILFNQHCSLNMAIVKMVIGFQLITEPDRGPLIPIRVMIPYTSFFCIKPVDGFVNSLEDFFHQIIGAKSRYDEHSNMRRVFNLRKMCRSVIRESIYRSCQENNFKFIECLMSLEIPETLKDYLRFRNLLY